MDPSRTLTTIISQRWVRARMLAMVSTSMLQLAKANSYLIRMVGRISWLQYRAILARRHSLWFRRRWRQGTWIASSIVRCHLLWFLPSRRHQIRVRALRNDECLLLKESVQTLSSSPHTSPRRRQRLRISIHSVAALNNSMWSTPAVSIRDHPNQSYLRPRSTQQLAIAAQHLTILQSNYSTWSRRQRPRTQWFWSHWPSATRRMTVKVSSVPRQTKSSLQETKSVVVSM